jgi:hypothetical protein
MLSGTAEPECRDRPSGVVPAVDTSMSGADQISPRPAASPESAHDPPQFDATTLRARATIHPSVNGVATAGCIAGSTAVI